VLPVRLIVSDLDCQKDIVVVSAALLSRYRVCCHWDIEFL
jgi:hypothetical protein